MLSVTSVLIIIQNRAYPCYPNLSRFNTEAHPFTYLQIGSDGSHVQCPPMLPQGNRNADKSVAAMNRNVDQSVVAAGRNVDRSMVAVSSSIFRR